MVNMTKEKTNYWNKIYLLLAFSIGIFIITNVFYTSFSSLHQENLRLKDFKADAFCKSQNYENVIVNKYRVWNGNCPILLRNIVSSIYPQVYYVRIYNTNTNKTISETLFTYDTSVKTEIQNSFDVRSCIDIIPTKIENKTFETGKYLPETNQIECLAEEICTNFKTCDTLNNELCKTEAIQHEEFKHYLNDVSYCSLSYQKSEKFPFM